MPAALITAPSGATLPRRIAMPPHGWIGAPAGWTTTPSGACGFTSTRLSALGLPGGGHALTMEESEVEELLHHDRNAADPVEVAHHELSGGSHVDEVRRPARHAVEVSEGEIDVRLARDRQQVQHGVRRSRDRHNDGDRVLER